MSVFNPYSTILALRYPPAATQESLNDAPFRNEQVVRSSRIVGSILFPATRGIPAAAIYQVWLKAFF